MGPPLAAKAIAKWPVDALLIWGGGRRWPVDEEGRGTAALRGNDAGSGNPPPPGAVPIAVIEVYDGTAKAPCGNAGSMRLVAAVTRTVGVVG